MKNLFTTKRLCRAGIISALYCVLTLVFMPFAFGPFQIRPAEALCILPLIFPEAIPAWFVGCALSNLLSQYSVYDLVLGSFATLLASFGTYAVGKMIKNGIVKVLVGGIFPVVCNAVIIPIIIVLIFGDTGGYGSYLTAYCMFALSIGFTELIWVYALGSPLYFSITRLQKNNRFLQ